MLIMVLMMLMMLVMLVVPDQVPDNNVISLLLVSTGQDWSGEGNMRVDTTELWS